MESQTLRATRRNQLGSRAAARLRRAGAVPAVLYGHQRANVHLALDLRQVEHVVHSGTRMVTLDIEGAEERALLKDIQYDAMGDHLLHVDLTRVALDEKVTVTVPVELHGLAKGVASGGTLDHLVQDIEVTCLPADIPERIRVEVAELEVGQMICVRDLQPPAGVTFDLEPDTPVVIIHEPVAEKEAAPPEEAEAAAAAEPEVIARRAEEEGDQKEES